MKFKLSFLLLSCLLLPCAARALVSDTRLIDIPTAEAPPVHSLGINTRMFSAGGMLAYFDFGVSSRFSIGISQTFEHLIGANDNNIKLLVPGLQAKFRFYDGNDAWPALAIGFDNQGFLYDHDAKKYTQTARGLYLGATKEVLTPGLIFNPGINLTVDGFEFDKFAAFLSAAYSIGDIAAVIGEWDNIRSLTTSRLNTGLRFYVVEKFHIDFALRNFNNRTERVVQLKYTIAM